MKKYVKSELETAKTYYNKGNYLGCDSTIDALVITVGKRQVYSQIKNPAYGQMLKERLIGRDKDDK